MLKTAKIYGINGPVIYLKGNTGFRMSEMVYVGEQKLVGEVIALDKDMTTVQVYEETTGLRPGEEVIASGSPVSVTLAPGILNNIFDGIERPLENIAESSGGAFITRGVSVDSLDRTKKWKAHITVKQGDYLHAGDIIAEVPETRAIVHKCMVPPEIEGTVIHVVSDGAYTIDETLITLQLNDGTTKELTMTQRWPIRVARPTHHRFPASTPLITGQRIIDTMFPIAKGGTAAVPGGFGTGKTMTHHQIAKWSNADIIIYIGCGERGNEMTQVLEEFSQLVDPGSGNPLYEAEKRQQSMLSEKQSIQQYSNVLLFFYIVRCPFSFCYPSVILFPVTDISAYQHRIFGLYPSVPVHLKVLTSAHPSLPPSSFFYLQQKHWLLWQ